MHTAQFSSSYRNQDTMQDIWQQELREEPGCCAGVAGLVSGGMERCVCGGGGVNAIIFILILYHVYCIITNYYMSI
jgi:hypothetical protein